MSIQWFPGHMHKAIKEIKKTLSLVDVVIEVLDSRIPFSSSNPVIDQLRGEKPGLKILTKSDLSDPDLTQQWLQYFERSSHIKALSVTTQQSGQIRQIIQSIKQLSPKKHTSDQPVTAMIMGIPNVGKSTLINIMADRTIAKTGNEPAVTKMQQRIKLDGINLLDTPGILWPKIHNEPSSYRLAVTGAIKDTAMEYEDVAFFLAEYLLATKPQVLVERYDLQAAPQSEMDFFDTAGAKRGCLRGGGQVDLNKISKLLLTEYRAGKLGRLTLETPEMVEKEIILVEQQIAEKEEKQRLRKEKNKQRRKR